MVFLYNSCIMSTINISLPAKLRSQANQLVKAGYFASFSDLVRASLRHTIEKSRYDVWADEAKEDLKKGKAVVLKSVKDVDRYFDKL